MNNKFYINLGFLHLVGVGYGESLAQSVVDYIEGSSLPNAHKVFEQYNYLYMRAFRDVVYRAVSNFARVRYPKSTNELNERRSVVITKAYFIKLCKKFPKCLELRRVFYDL